MKGIAWAAKANCEVRTDALTRQLYATDASIYQMEPMAVAFPRSVEEAASVIRCAADAGIAITPRGAGTGLAGGALGHGLVIDLARHNRDVSNLNIETGTVCAGAGVVLDQLNLHLKAHGLCFGPDVATSSRATLGGMIANNSSGARAPFYGTTSDHVVSLDVFLADGRIARVGSGHDSLPELHSAVNDIVARNAAAIEKWLPEGLVKRRPGYALDRWLRRSADLATLITGSEGTLAGIWAATVRVVPIPKRKGLGLIFFDSIAEAMQATVELLDLKPVAIEHMDRVLFDQTKNQLPFKSTRALLRLDEAPCEAILIVEFYDEVPEKLAALERRNLGTRTLSFTDPRAMEMVWAMRKAGLSLLTGAKGPAKPVAGLEDVAVRPEQLPDFVASVQALLEPLGMESSFYGHAASGLLHIRPVVDLHCAEDIAKFRRLAVDLFQLTRAFRGSMAGEHGVGIARAEFLADQIGPELMCATAEIKAVFDPKNVMNPGKILPDGSCRIDNNLRQGAGYRIHAPFESVLAFAAKDESFVANLEQCNGCGECLKSTPTMCPTYIATRDEIMSTRGRANIIRAVLDGRLTGGVTSAELEAALSNCLSCKACATECPSNVSLPLLKADLLHARHKQEGLGLFERLVSSVDRLGVLGCLWPTLANAVVKARPARKMMERLFGIAQERPLPLYARQRFDHWFASRRNGSETAAARPLGRVILWDDCFVRYHEPQVGKAAVAVLEAAGYEVVLPQGRVCCGRPAFSMGRLDRARKLGVHNVALLRKAEVNDRRAPVVFLEPSCYSMFVDDYRELRIPHAEDAARRCVLFEQLMLDTLEEHPDALRFQGDMRVAIHAHCHAKALTNADVMPKLAGKLPNSTVTLLNTGCCGMAGAFGMLKSKYDLSLQVAQPLVDLIRALEPGTLLVASGTSCRQQISHLTDAAPLHMAELLAQASHE